MKEDENKNMKEFLTDKEFKKLSYIEKLKYLANGKITTEESAHLEDDDFVDHINLRINGLCFAVDGIHYFASKHEAIKAGKKLKQKFSKKLSLKLRRIENE